MRKITGLILILNLIFIKSFFGQEYIDVKQLPKPDCNANDWEIFNSKEDKILVFPDNVIDSLFLKLKEEKSKDWDKANIKTESELTDLDLNKPLCLYGLIGEFKNWNKLDTLIKQIEMGFIFDGKSFSNNNDGLQYISPNRQITIANSSRTLQILKSTATYKFLALNDGVLSRRDRSDNLIMNIDSVRFINYDDTITNYFKLFTSKQITISDFQPDIFVDKICVDLSLNKPKEKIVCYLHKTGNEFLFFSNAYYMTGCKDWNMGNDFGMTESLAIHCIGDIKKSFKHETFHKTWELCVGKSSNSFFIEGIQEYYTYLKSDSIFHNSIALVKKYPDFDITNLALIGNRNDFWGGPSENNWPIAYNFSGCFTKYLIENWGLDSFKNVYLIDDKEKAFRTYYKKESQELIADFYKWVNNYGS